MASISKCSLTEGGAGWADASVFVNKSSDSQKNSKKRSIKYKPVVSNLLSFRYGLAITCARQRSPTPTGIRVAASPVRYPTKSNIKLPPELNMAMFDKPIQV
ncbi:hypothetical protein niasHT_036821 [Heterodera trifolii]|uniref:Uncharacterized protein n=1 Tax=Heterodera trifolii TaxID=157864 RepID=A0ABD2J4G0_9BILA